MLASQPQEFTTTIPDSLSDDAIRKAEFNKKYPTVDFDDLTPQLDGVATNDGCRHYIMKNKYGHSRLFSWNYKTKMWVEHPQDYHHYIINRVF